jgi:hypothetical protein
MFSKLCALLRKKPETVIPEFPITKKKPTVKKATTRTVKKPVATKKTVKKSIVKKK